MRFIAVVAVLVLLTVGFSGCYTLNAIGTPSDLTISMSNQPAGTMVKHFSVNMKVHHLIYGLVTLNSPDIAKAVSDEVKSSGGSHAVNVKLTYQMTFVDGLVNAITFSVYSPFTMILEGDVVK
jgi:hypothetical protein